MRYIRRLEKERSSLPLAKLETIGEYHEPFTGMAMAYRKPSDVSVGTDNILGPFKRQSFDE